MLLGKPFIERRRKQKPRRAVKLPEIAVALDQVGIGMRDNNAAEHQSLLCIHSVSCFTQETAVFS
jgi:hypothetical protein